MAWPVTFVGHGWPDRPFTVGEAWTVEIDDMRGLSKLSQHYRRIWADKRKPLVVMCPRAWWCVDEAPTNSPEASWIVAVDIAQLVPGTLLTSLDVTPSINIDGIYHGWVRNGVITDDCEGRTFPSLEQAG
jgi:hypothetical protein